MPRTSRAIQFGLVVLTLLLCGSVATAGPKQKLAILGIEAVVGANGRIDPTDTQFAKELTAALRERANSSTGYDLIRDSRELVDEKLMNNCGAEHPTCMAPIGAQMGAESLLFGRVENTKDGYKVTLKLISVSKKQQLASLPNELISIKDTKGVGLQSWTRTAYKKLTGESSDGTLVIRVAGADGGTVYVNNEPKGTLRSGTATLTLGEGRYKIGVEADGFKLWEEKDVTVRLNESTELKPDLVKGDTGTIIDPPIKEREGTVSGKKNKTLFKVVAAVGLGGAAIAGGYWAYSYIGPIRDFDGTTATFTPTSGTSHAATQSDCGKAGMVESNNQSKFDSACSAYKRTKWLIPTTIGLGLVGAGALVYLMISKDDTEQRPTSTVGRRVKKRTFAVTPVITPNGTGATLQFDW